MESWREGERTGRDDNICHRDHDRRVNWTHDRSSYSHRLVVSNGDVFDHQRLRINTPQRGRCHDASRRRWHETRGGGGLEVVHGQSNEKSFGAYEDNDAWFVCVCVSVMKEVPKKVVWRERRRQRFAWWRREKMTSTHAHTTPACSYVFSGSCTFSLSSNSQNYIWKHSVGKHSLKTNVPSTLTQFHDFRLTRTRYTISRRVWKFWWENVSVLKLYSDLSFTSPKKQRCQYYRSIFTLFLRMNAESVGRGDESLASLNVLI